jgi:hypothetical protein
MKLAAFTAKELLFNCLNAVVPVAFYCRTNGVYIRDAVILVSLPRWDSIYTRDTVISVEMLLHSSRSVPDMTSPAVRHLNQGKSNFTWYLLYFCPRFDDTLPRRHNHLLPQGIGTSGSFRADFSHSIYTSRGLSNITDAARGKSGDRVATLLFPGLRAIYFGVSSSQTIFPRAFVASLGKPLISRVAAWKQLHLYQCSGQTRHKHSSKMGLRSVA